ncbi:hypothetical protein ESP57_07100 [Agromyces fucosus]|uniref:Amino acid permease n=1 Tax=Agromyces fucosus TaxID=41985 RepID=A0A4Q2JKW0_9MICO|nr:MULTISPECIES: hypothetical protein [Agromyces]KQZ10839.1 hypothetical protein ASD23_01355 [Agromyces sp. Root1464]RXZ48751.1 hypothetical protein ESP57_07100 [Agromyces fucosus]
MLAAVALCAILAALAVFQLALALGAPLGRFAWGGQHRVLPTRLRIGSAVSIVIYAVIAVLALDRAGAVDVVSDVVSTVGMWVVFAYFVLGIPMNAISRSTAERYTMTPIVAVLAVLSLVIAIG